jgi:hypothetical protein
MIPIAIAIGDAQKLLPIMDADWGLSRCCYAQTNDRYSNATLRSNGLLC